VPKTFVLIELIPLRIFKLLFISFMFLRNECDIPFKLLNSDSIKKNYVGKTGCYNWYQSRSVHPAKYLSRVVSFRSWNTIIMLF
jgi:hypothetical protein